jgi:phosphatidylinositol glycan class U
MADTGMFLTLLSIFPEVWPCTSSRCHLRRKIHSNFVFVVDLRHPLPTAMWHVYASTLLPLFNNLWLGQGTGNSNFFYAATLVFGVANGAALLDSTWAGLTLPYGQPKEGYTLLQI